MDRRDRAAHAVAQWRDERPDLDASSMLGSVYIRNAHANARNRPQGKEQGAPFGRAKQATRDAAMRAISGIPLE
ncbi:hypothetical protein [Burkholderia ubonensis]|uniref:hypothetical protein n=1 Tax=Burkholderia ubonensis TaxID=101571 RepID=UPI0009B304B7